MVALQSCLLLCSCVSGEEQTDRRRTARGTLPVPALLLARYRRIQPQEALSDHRADL